MFEEISLKDIVISLIDSVDHFNYLLKEHHKRVTIIAYNIAKKANLSSKEISKLVLSAALHDIGALTIEDRDQLIEIDVNSPEKHEKIGYTILKDFEPFEEIAQIIRHHHIHWSDVGTTVKSDEISELCHIIHLADRIDILLDYDYSIVLQREKIIREIEKRKGTVFSPKYVDLFAKLATNDIFWHDIEFESFSYLLHKKINNISDIPVNKKRLEELAITFSRIADFRSHYTASHSVGVATTAYNIGKMYGLSNERCTKLKIAGYLHDIGKVAIDYDLIEKKGKLTSTEYEEVKKHAYFTQAILSRINNFDEISELASKHHERRDGTGYPYHNNSDNFTIDMDIIAFADIICALREKRPYKRVLTKNECIEKLVHYTPKHLNKKVLGVIIDNFDRIDQKRIQVQKEEKRFYLSSAM